MSSHDASIGDAAGIRPAHIDGICSPE